ncbi:MAG TPA: hypothetical protein VFU94_10425 [Conexibacter sp.]|nr:hypothetical protein [Conexibacter sp.]
MLLEAPGSYADRDAVVAEIELPSGRSAKVLSRVDVLLDRLDEFQATGHQIVGQQALVLIAGLSSEEDAALEARAAARRVGAVLRAMRRLADDLASGRAQPESDELHEIARDALRVEYSRTS